MKVLITGNAGYVGSVLTRHLRKQHPHWELHGLDTLFFAAQVVPFEHDPSAREGTRSPVEHDLDVQHVGDLRDFDFLKLSGQRYDAIVHLAAISNDPIGNRFERVTEDVNVRATERLLDWARINSTKRIVFASSCSVYGAGSDSPRKESDELGPLTVYARSKVAVENMLGDYPHMTTALRFATAFGASPRLRLDLVMNDFVWRAQKLGKILIKSDGTPWRPIVHVEDMARAIDWALQREDGWKHATYNVGSDEMTYQIVQMAEQVKSLFNDMWNETVTVDLDPKGGPDKRSYRVDFGNFSARAGFRYRPQTKIVDAVDELASQCSRINKLEPYMRLNHLMSMQNYGLLTPELSWVR